MKKVYLILWFAAIVPASLSAQEFTDSNTDLINTYFQINNSKAGQENAATITQQPKGVVIIQNGNFNETYIQSVQADDRQTIIQNGDKNSYEFYNYYSSDRTNLQINQQGQGNSLQIYGENSLMEKAVINQRSNFKTLIIKNYTN